MGKNETLKLLQQQIVADIYGKIRQRIECSVKLRKKEILGYRLHIKYAKI